MFILAEQVMWGTINEAWHFTKLICEVQKSFVVRRKYVRILLDYVVYKLTKKRRVAADLCLICL